MMEVQMPDPLSPIARLIDEQHKAHEIGIMLNVPPNIRGKIRADLEAVAKAKQAGRKTPSFRTLSEFFQSEYSYRVSKTCIQEWMTRISKDLLGGKKTSD
jgi:hypothetical protein